MKKRIFEWVKKHHNEYVLIEQIKQTNISFRKKHYQESYYFEFADWISPYTMKRWLEIAEGKLYDSWKTTHGTWYWIKNNEVIN